MILIGEGKNHADNLPDCSYYHNNAPAIAKTLFVDTCFGIRFTPVIFETIKKSHKTLPYLLRNTFANAEQVFKKVIDIPKGIVIENCESTFCFDVYSRLAVCDELAEFYEDVCDKLIYPVYERDNFYRPVMSTG
jgi:hypothetical protein